MNPSDLQAGVSAINVPMPLLETRSSGIALWRPEVILAKTITPAPPRPKVVIAEPGQRPEAVRAQMDAARSALRFLDRTRRALGARAAALEEKAAEAGSERGRVTAMIETYRVKSTLDDALRGALRRVSVLMEERGQR